MLLKQAEQVQKRQTEIDLYDIKTVFSAELSRPFKAFKIRGAFMSFDQLNTEFPKGGLKTRKLLDQKLIKIQDVGGKFRIS